MWRYVMLGFIPLALGLDWAEANSLLVFLASALAIVPLASLMGEATEHLATFLGPTVGGLLNASLGNAPEIIIALFALSRGLEDVVKASLTGSIIGNLLLGLGLAMVAGGAKYSVQKFSTASASLSASMLFLAGVGLLIPTFFQISTTTPDAAKTLSLEIACVLLVVYASGLLFSLVTHRHFFSPDKAREAEEHAGEAHAPWSKGKALGVLAAVTLVLAGMSEVLTGAIEGASTTLGLTPIFAGIFLLAPVGNMAELLNAVRFARKNHMELSFGITAGASAQVALLVAPLLVLASRFLGDKPMDLHFTNLEVIAIVIAIFSGRNLWTDGESSWMEGVMLIAIYVLLGVGFFHLPA